MPGALPRTDDEGYLIDPGDWTDEVAKELARREDIDLTDDHWEALMFMRRYLDEHQVAPDARHVMKHLTQTRGAGRNRLFELFPYGYVQQACKIAGMKRPRAWSTG
ncbi:MAG TPA: TusE/DsrC/DsvC family sulfur relay protein [Azospirillum sp.]|nr:TusE/DsrC/DsvC family sulfur relay protein [Azospirillum sp.]